MKEVAMIAVMGALGNVGSRVTDLLALLEQKVSHPTAHIPRRSHHSDHRDLLHSPSARGRSPDSDITGQDGMKILPGGNSSFHERSHSHAKEVMDARAGGEPRRMEDLLPRSQVPRDE